MDRFAYYTSVQSPNQKRLNNININININTSTSTNISINIINSSSNNSNNNLKVAKIRYCWNTRNLASKSPHSFPVEAFFGAGSPMR